MFLFGYVVVHVCVAGVFVFPFVCVCVCLCVCVLGHFLRGGTLTRGNDIRVTPGMTVR